MHNKDRYWKYWLFRERHLRSPSTFSALLSERNGQDVYNPPSFLQPHDAMPRPIGKHLNRKIFYALSLRDIFLNKECLLTKASFQFIHFRLTALAVHAAFPFSTWLSANVFWHKKPVPWCGLASFPWINPRLSGGIFSNSTELYPTDLEINISQMCQWFYLVVLFGMIEPSRTDRHIHFRRIPIECRAF